MGVFTKKTGNKKKRYTRGISTPIVDAKLLSYIKEPVKTESWEVDLDQQKHLIVGVITEVDFNNDPSTMILNIIVCERIELDGETVLNEELFKIKLNKRQISNFEKQVQLGNKASIRYKIMGGENYCTDIKIIDTSKIDMSLRRRLMSQRLPMYKVRNSNDYKRWQKGEEEVYTDKQQLLIKYYDFEDI